MNSFFIVLAVFVVVFVGYSYFNYLRMTRFYNLPENDAIVTLTDKNFTKITSKGIVLIDFWASWCMPCKMMIPVLNQVAESLQGNAIVAKVNVEEYQRLAGKFQVRNIPTMLLMKDGKEVDRFVGVKSQDFLIKRIQSAN
jgi:thioredoxin 1